MLRYYAWKDSKTKEVKVKSREDLPKGKPPEGSEEVHGPFEAPTKERALDDALLHYYIDGPAGGPPAGGSPAGGPIVSSATKTRVARLALLVIIFTAFVLTEYKGYGVRHWASAAASKVQDEVQDRVEEWRERRRQKQAREKAKRARREAKKQARKTTRDFRDALIAITEAQKAHDRTFGEPASLQELKESFGAELPEGIEVIQEKWIRKRKVRFLLAHPNTEKICVGKIAYHKEWHKWRVASLYTDDTGYKHCQLVPRGYIEKRFF